MVSETKRVFKGITHINAFLFYHDALLLMTAKETCNCTEERGYKEMWSLPEMDILHSNPVLKRFRGRPYGNIPELCNLDSCLNEDLHKAVDCHVSYTHSLNKSDPIFLVLQRQIKEHHHTF